MYKGVLYRINYGKRAESNGISNMWEWLRLRLGFGKNGEGRMKQRKRKKDKG